MAVPANGSLSLFSLGNEKQYNDYGATPDVVGPYSLADITLGGDTYSGGAGESYDVTNGLSSSHPNNVASYGMSEFYSYDHDSVAPACNMTYHNGGQGTFNYPISLGSATGTVTIEYQAYSIPDKFVFTWNGNTYTSGSGNGNGAGFVGAASQLSALQATPGNSSATITTLTTSYGSGSGQQQNGGRGTITFNKNTSSSTSNMQVSAPLGGTGWWFSVSCPGSQVIGGGTGVAPTVSTVGAASISEDGFVMRGTVSSLGLASDFTTTGTVTARGYVYKTGATSTSFISGETGVTTAQVDTTNATGSFSKVLTGLSSSTTFTYRAYATNSAGTTYGGNEQATTASSATAPSVTTNTISSVASTSMTLNGNLTSNGGATVTAKGFVYSALISNPFLGGMGVQSVTVSNPNTTGTYNTSITSLQSSTTHYVKAYATNSQGTSYGSVTSASTTTSYNTRWIAGPYAKNVFACGQEQNLEVKFTGAFSNGTTLYDDSLNLMNDTNGGSKWYGGPPASTAGSASSNTYFYVNSSGVVSNYTLESC